MHIRHLKTYKGGAPRKKLPKATQRLLEILIDRLGGHLSISLLLGVNRQAPINWRKAGYVPLELVGPISRKLGVSAYALNFYGTSDFTGVEKSFAGVVSELKIRGSNLSKEESKYILAGKL